MQSVKTDQTVDAQADLSLCWLHKSHCRFCCALADFYFSTTYIGSTHRDAFNEYPEYRFLWRTGENYPRIINEYYLTIPLPFKKYRKTYS